MQFQMLCILESVLNFLNGFSIMSWCCCTWSTPKQIAVHFGIPNTHQVTDLFLQPPLALAELILEYALAPLYFISGFFFSFSKTRADRNSGDEQSNLCTWKCSSNAVSACLTIKTTKDYNPAFLALLTFYILTHSLILLGRKFSDRVSDLCLFSVNNFTMPKRPFPWWGGPSQR